MNKETIIRVITTLENHPELRLTNSRQLPGSLITTTLNLPLGESDINISAHFTNPALPVDLTKKPPGRSQSGPRARSKSGNNDKNNQRKPSPSPNRGKPSGERGRSPGKKVTETKPSARAYSTDIDPELDCLQYYSRYSQSPNEVRKKSIPSIFRRPFTPRSHEHLKKNYFMNTTGDKRFSDVRTKGFCLRCYGSNHKAASCKTYTRPTPTPCKYCFHLFHSPDECKFYTSDGKSRPPSVNRAPK